MWHRLAHRVGRSSQATPAAVDKSLKRLEHKNSDSPVGHDPLVANSAFFDRSEAENDDERTDVRTRLEARLRSKSAAQSRTSAPEAGFPDLH
ncbi:MAG: hypothetical protein M3R04_10525, partial [bacterium]|nr:hypothetical protein [bacterium]